MRLYLFRHGIARDANHNEDDAARPLTAEGVRLTTAAAHGLAKIIDRPEAILTSPRLRALQTAQLLGEVFESKPQIVAEIGVDAPTAIIRHLRQREESSVVVVGHEPTLSTLAQQLIAGTADPCGLELKKAGCAFLEVDWGKSDRPIYAMLHWLLTPAVLRAPSIKISRFRATACLEDSVEPWPSGFIPHATIVTLSARLGCPLGSPPIHFIQP